MPAIVPKKYEDMRREFWAECVRLGELASAMYQQNVMRHLYVMGRRRRGLDTLNPHAAIWEVFTIAEDAGAEDWEGVIGEPIPRNYPFAEYPSWIQERLRREPMWIFAD